MKKTTTTKTTKTTKTTTTKTVNIKTLITSNRKNTRALKLEQFKDNKTAFTNWKTDCEALRIAVSQYATDNRQNEVPTVLKTSQDNVFLTYKKVLGHFTNKAIDEKVQPQTTDLNALLTMIGCNKKEKDNNNGKQFLPVGEITFRKSIEDFLCDRIQNNGCKTAEQIKAERKARKDAEKAAKKALLEKEKAAAKKSENTKIA